MYTEEDRSWEMTAIAEKPPLLGIGDWNTSRPQAFVAADQAKIQMQSGESHGGYGVTMIEEPA
ncbi:hypothetical protein Bca4012_057399 [Brassica carinata]|uniref:Uncharacterized protein n=1 Tax=Brassica carinata TaxID=52824 RepID=A0A8X7W3H1_BRACI|nr:hypothetical protein Bca52824_014721 [Brassica carinata]